MSITDLALSLNTFEQMNTVILSLQKIKTKLNEGLYWNGEYDGKVFESAGSSRMPMQPSINIHPPANLSRYYFDLNMINDIGVHLILSEIDESNVIQTSEGTLNIAKKCFICRNLLFIGR